jgi:predicted cupin superfamily sugar epimerase
VSHESLTPEDIIAHLRLGPHPEGGYFRETFRDPKGHGERSHSTAILYLLPEGEISRWHKVDAAELWHWYGGAPLLLRVREGEHRRDVTLGPDWLKGEHPHALVPAHAWQSARSLGAWTLAGWRLASTSLALSSRPKTSSPSPYTGRH